MATIADLIMRQGEIAARGAERSGEIWGNAVSQLGQIGAGAFQQYTAQKEEKKRMAMFDEAMSSFDPANPGDFYRKAAVAIGPEAATSAVRAFAALEETKRRNAPDPKLFAEQARFLKQMRQTNPGWVTTHWSEIATAIGPQAEALYGVKVGPEYSEEYGQMLDAFNPDDPAGEEYTLTPGAARFRGGEQIAAVPAAAPAPPKTLAEIEAEATARARGTRAGNPPAPSDGGARPLTQTAEAGMIARLSGQYTKAAAPALELSRQVKIMDAGLEAARRGDLAAGSQAVLVTFQKILDPTSVVRESEYARSAAGQALLARIEGAYERLRKGGAGVPVSELEKFAKLGREMTEATTGYLKSVATRIGKVADRYQIPHELVMEDFSFDAPATVPAGSVSVTAPNGKTYTFPNQAQADVFKKRAGIK